MFVIEFTKDGHYLKTTLVSIFIKQRILLYSLQFLSKSPVLQIRLLNNNLILSRILITLKFLIGT